ncbi:MAG: hypothetical protein ACPGXL_03545 [Chitinophagales bacterium]
MEEKNKSIPQSGNIFGWRISFYSFILIFITLLGVIYSDRYHAKHPKVSSTEIQDTTATVILETMDTLTKNK